MNLFVKIAMRADPVDIIKDFAQADNAAQKFAATLSGMKHVGSAAFTGIKGSLDAAEQKVTGVGKTFRNIGLGWAAGLAGATIAAAKFQTSMADISTLINPTKDVDGMITMMRDHIMELSQVTPQGLNDLSSALYDIVSAGFDGTQATGALDVSARAASAGLTSTNTAVTALTAAMNAYGPAAFKGSTATEKFKNISDVMFQGVNVGIFRFEDLTGMLAETAGIANGAGVGLKELVGGMATMTRSGLSASEAGTSMNRVLQKMIQPSAALTEQFHKMGFESGLQAIKTMGLVETMSKLREASHGNVNTLVNWFTEIRAARGAMALMANGGQNLTDVMNGMSLSAGATDRAFAKQSNTFNVKFAELKNTIAGIGVEIGSAFLPILSIVLDLATAFTGLWHDIPGPIRAIIPIIMALASAIMIVGGAFVAWKVKGLATMIMMRAVGTGLEKVETAFGRGSSRTAEYGRSLQRVHGPLSMTRALFMGAGTAAMTMSDKLKGLSTTTGKAGDAIGMGSNRIGTIHQRAMAAGAGVTFLQHAMSRVGVSPGMEQAVKMGGKMASVGVRAGAALDTMNRSLSKVGKFAAQNLGTIASFGTAAITGLMALNTAFSNANNKGKEFADTLASKFDTASPGGIVKAMDAMQKQIDKTNAKFDTGFLNGAAEVVHATAEAFTGLVGVDLGDTIWDWKGRLDGLNKKQKELIVSAKNMEKNYTSVWNRTHPDDYRKSLSLTGVEVKQMDKAAVALGIDMSGAFVESGTQRDKLVKGMRELNKTVGVTSQAFKNLGPKDLKKLNDDMNTFMQSVHDATLNGSDLLTVFGKIGETHKGLDTAHISTKQLSKEMGKSFQDLTKQAMDFSANLETAAKMGLNPTMWSQLATAGPEQAGPILQRLVGDTTGTMITIANNYGAVLEGIAQRTALFSKITFMAVHDQSGKLIGEIPKANRIGEEIAKQGFGRATFASVTNALLGEGFTPTEIKQINADFGLGLTDAFTWDPGPAADKINKDLKGAFSKTFKGVFAATGLDSDTTQKITDHLKSMKTSVNAFATDPLTGHPDFTQFSTEFNTFLDSLGVTAEQKKVMIPVILNQTMKERAVQEIKEITSGPHGVKITGPQRKLMMDLAIRPPKKADVDKLISFMDKKEVEFFLTRVSPSGKLDPTIRKYIYSKHPVVSLGLDLTTSTDKDSGKIMKLLEGTKSGAKGTTLHARMILSVLGHDWKTALSLVEGMPDSRTKRMLLQIILTEKSKKDLKHFVDGIKDENIFPHGKHKKAFLEIVKGRNFDRMVQLLKSKFGLSDADIVTTLIMRGDKEALHKAKQIIRQYHLTPKQIHTSAFFNDLTKAQRKEIDDWLAKEHVTHVQAWPQDFTAGMRSSIDSWLHQPKETDVFANIIQRGAPPVINGAGGPPVVDKDPNKPGIQNAHGNILTFGMGGEAHKAQIGNGMTKRIWNEPETGGEAYIPMSPAKRGRSTDILSQVADSFGYNLLPNQAGSSTHTVNHGDNIVVHGSTIVVQGGSDASMLAQMQRQLDARDAKLVQKIRAKRGSA